MKWIGCTNLAKGLIRERNWYGPDGMENARTKKEPKQSIPTFVETVELLMKVLDFGHFIQPALILNIIQEENRHVLFNVDVKVFNDPVRLFTLMHKVISSHGSWETLLAPRIVLGLWHPKFVGPAQEILPYCTRSHIGLSPHLARRYFWEGCSAFSMNFGALQTGEGARFRSDCKAAGKKIMVWTVNDPKQMMEVHGFPFLLRVFHRKLILSAVHSMGSGCSYHRRDKDVFGSARPSRR